jgi:hypothetical protein
LAAACSIWVRRSRSLLRLILWPRSFSMRWQNLSI